MMSLWQYAASSIVLMLGGALIAALMTRKPGRLIMQDLLSLSGAFLFGVLILELMPDIFHEEGHSVAILFIAGFFLQTGMDYWTSGIEHGHLHVPPTAGKTFVFSLFIGLGLHAILDGLPFAGIDFHGHQHGSIYLAVLLHKLVEGFTLFILLGMLGYTTRVTWLHVSLFSFITPLGMVLFSSIPFLLDHYHQVLAFAGGSLLHVAVTILFESEHKHHHGMPVRKLISILIGLLMAGLTVMG
ncbi:MAG TPA: ZIP family metal transporter [Saprospiraceae bacterium]|nr:ZIP family metal transporter [Saprospiraceae bacterium]HNT20227.1 ZIP family metal transporter [Saprospiraceae bacterium]